MIFKKGQIVFWEDSLYLFLLEKEEIKENDFYYDTKNHSVRRCSNLIDVSTNQYRKIIATTDETINTLPRIPKKFKKECFYQNFFQVNVEFTVTENIKSNDEIIYEEFISEKLKPNVGWEVILSNLIN